jgi:membrane protein DedA with SNARE-associated domain/rhodanese-related sulfurtransferase
MLGSDSHLGQLELALIAGNVLLDQAGLPIPAVPALMLAGALAVGHPAWGVELFVFSVLACLVADVGWFWAGRAYGGRVMRLLCRISLSPDTCVRETQVRFERWGDAALIVTKFVPGLSLLSPPLAGALSMSWSRFLALRTVGGILWVGVYLVLGALLAQEIKQLVPRLAQFGVQALPLVAAALLAYIAYKWWQRRRFYAMLRMARISPAELYALMGVEPLPVVLDVRSVSARTLDARWIPGALHIPLDQVEACITTLARDREVIVYCTCPNEASAARVAKLLIKEGFTRVRPLLGGLDAWVAAGYPTHPPTDRDPGAAPANAPSEAETHT